MRTPRGRRSDAGSAVDANDELAPPASAIVAALTRIVADSRAMHLGTRSGGVLATEVAGGHRGSTWGGQVLRTAACDAR